MTETVQTALRSIEAEHGVRIIYACESGSRAWGFASPGSDYDVRFVYTRPVESYLSITAQKDVLEIPVDELLDVNGWDVRKALQLFLTSNPPLYEWLQSPVVYRQQTGFMEDFRPLMKAYFSLRAGWHHYGTMARRIFENDLQADSVRLKKYFYALRCSLAALWIVRKRELPPMEFGRLRELEHDMQWQRLVDELLEQKAVSNEKTLVRPLAELQSWLQKALHETSENAHMPPAAAPSPEPLNKLFRKWIQ